MSNILSSSNTLILVGVGILAVLVIFLAVWLARMNSRASKDLSSGSHMWRTICRALRTIQRRA